METDIKQIILRNICALHGQITSIDVNMVVKGLFNPLSPVNVVVLLTIILIFTYTSLSSLIIIDNHISKIRLGLYSVITYIVLMLFAYYFIFNSICQQISA